ncbi:MAG: (4Fe-4S)-binding protein [Bacteroidetes bacterium]|nr:(4Fe-4S)-binding protein [Bacteroidota bacterium]
MSNKITKAESEELKNNRGRSRSYTNDEITVFWRPELCIHSANCLIGLPGVFDSSERPWVNIRGASSKEIIKTVNTCPSRALLFMKNESVTLRKNRKKSRKPPKFARVQILKDGPAIISGNFILRDSDKKKIRLKTDKAAICRCGASHKKPLCDGTHLRIGFKDSDL